MAKRIAVSTTTYIAIAGVLVILVLLVAVVSVHRKINKDAEVRAADIAKNISENNFTLVTNLFNSYEQIVELLGSVREAAKDNEPLLLSALADKCAGDSAVAFYWYRSHVASSVSYSNRIVPDFMEIIPSQKANRIGAYLTTNAISSKPLLCIFVANGLGQAELGIAIDLKVFHSKLINVRELGQAYTKIVTADRLTIYNPDRSLIGMIDSELSTDDIAELKSVKEISDDSVYLKPLAFGTHRTIFKDSIGSSRVFLVIYVPEVDFNGFIRKTQMNIFLLIVLPLVLLTILIVLGVVSWKREFLLREKVEKKELRLKLDAEKHLSQLVTSELENLKNGVNPHFLFNSLGSLIALIKRDTIKAVEFTQTLSNQYRYLLETEGKHIVNMEKELAFTIGYISIQNIRFGNSIKVDIAAVPRLDYGVPPLALQTLVENSIKHNTASMAKPLHILIYEEDGYIIVVNSYAPRVQQAESTGKGITNLIKRYAYLTEKECAFYIKEQQYIAKIPLLKI